jgi:tetrapyrrole methylase family protein/MazG family protein
MSEAFDRVVALMGRLRAPQGCPWDRKQTHESLKPYLLEETYEVLETIDHGDMTKLKEELGDVLLQVLFHSQIAGETARFTITEVLQHLGDKLVRRHPHVFGSDGQTESSLNPDQVVSRWEEIKRAERQDTGRRDSALDGVPKTLPALLRAYQVQARASRVGFDWSHDRQGLDCVLDKIAEELQELREVCRTTPSPDAATGAAHVSPESQTRLAAELGDLLFSIVNLSRLLKLNPEDALRQTIHRFERRFSYIEQASAATGRTIDALSFDEMNRFWDEAKRQEPARPLPESVQPQGHDGQ